MLRQTTNLQRVDDELKRAPRDLSTIPVCQGRLNRPLELINLGQGEHCLCSGLFIFSSWALNITVFVDHAVIVVVASVAPAAASAARGGSTVDPAAARVGVLSSSFTTGSTDLFDVKTILRHYWKSAANFSEPSKL